MAIEVLALARNADVSLGDIAHVVSRDPALAARILRLANSSFFGATAKAGTVTQALVRLGLRASLSVVLGFSVVTEFSHAATQSPHMRCIWNMSLLSSVAAKIIEERTRGHFMEEAFTAALLQDLGMLAMITTVPEHYVDVLNVVRDDSSVEVHEIEQSLLGTNHMDVGVYLLSMWNVPDSIVGPIGAHHSPDALRPTNYDDYRLARAMQAADSLSRLICQGRTHANILRCIRLFRDYLRWPPTFIVPFVRDLVPSIRQFSRLLSIEISDDLLGQMNQAASPEPGEVDVWNEAIQSVTGGTPDDSASPDQATVGGS